MNQPTTSNDRRFYYNPYCLMKKQSEVVKQACLRSGTLLCQVAVTIGFFLPCRFACGQETADPFLGGSTWQVYTNNPILSPGPSGSWDAGALETMTVVKAGNLYHMYYEGWTQGTNDGLGAIQIGHAVSSDGVHWTKDPANPVLPSGTGNDWDSGGTWDPSVIYENGLFKLWYGGAGADGDNWGYATSTDGTHFVKQGQLSYLGQVEDDHVVHDPTSGGYFMYYWNRQYEPEGLYCAQSPNETNFDFADAQPIHLVGVPYTNTMYKFPNVFQEGGQWYMYFGEFIRPSCVGCWTGYATSRDGLHWQVQNPQMIQCHDAFVVKMTNDLYFMYYGPDGYFDQPSDDIRLAEYSVIPAVVITNQPQDVGAYVGAAATFTVGATVVGMTNSLPRNYQWQTNGVDIAGATNATYTTPALTPADNGAYYDCIVTAGTLSATTRNALLLVVPGGTSYADSVLADHPVVCYRFEESPGSPVAADFSGNGNNGSYTNVSLGNPSAFAGLGQAAGFSGLANSLVGVPALGSATSLGGSGNHQVTIEAWIDPAQLSGADSIYTVDTWQNGIVHLLVNGSSIRFTVGNSVNVNGSQDDANFPSSAAIAVGQWAYLAVVYDDSVPSSTLYINGQSVATNYYSTTYPISLNSGAIGVQTDGGDPPYSGLIDEFAIYTNALTAAEIQAHYAAALSQQPHPTLSIGRSGNEIVISWNGTGFTLQETTNLMNSASWVDVPDATNSPVTVPIGNSLSFYRLRSQ